MHRSDGGKKWEKEHAPMRWEENMDSREGGRETERRKTGESEKKGKKCRAGKREAREHPFPWRVV